MPSPSLRTCHPSPLDYLNRLRVCKCAALEPVNARTCDLPGLPLGGRAVAKGLEWVDPSSSASRHGRIRICLFYSTLGLGAMPHAPCKFLCGSSADELVASFSLGCGRHLHSEGEPVVLAPWRLALSCHTTSFSSKRVTGQKIHTQPSAGNTVSPQETTETLDTAITRWLTSCKHQA